jgi:hypothetical protein
MEHVDGQPNGRRESHAEHHLERGIAKQVEMALDRLDAGDYMAELVAGRAQSRADVVWSARLWRRRGLCNSKDPWKAG